MTYICITYGVNLGGTFAEKKTLGREYRALYYCENFTQGRPGQEIWLLILCTVSMWIRVFYMLRYNEWLGKLTGVLEKLLQDIMIFFCFFVVEVMFFAAVAELCFRNLLEYGTFVEAFKNLFYASFGQFRFDQF